MTRYDETEEFWAAILSEDRDQVRLAWQSLDVEERALVLAHLRKMTTPEENYAEVQRAAAQFAVAVVAGTPN